MLTKKNNPKKRAGDIIEVSNTSGRLKRGKQAPASKRPRFDSAPSEHDSYQPNPSRSSKPPRKQTSCDDVPLTHMMYQASSVPSGPPSFAPDTSSSKHHSPSSSHLSEYGTTYPISVAYSPTDFSRLQHFGWEKPIHQQRAYDVPNILQPHLDTAPTSPPLKFEHSPQSSGWPEECLVALPIQEYSSSTPIMPVPVTQPPMLPSSVPFDQDPFTQYGEQQYHGLPISEAIPTHERYTLPAQHGEQQPHGIYCYEHQTAVGRPMPFVYAASAPVQ